MLFVGVAGSRAYGTATAESDEDLRGLFAVPAAEYLALDGPRAQVGDERSNVVYFSLRRALELLAAANPNVLELLFLPGDCVRQASPEMTELIAHRRLFLTRHCADTYLGYALAQVKRAKGQNKWINNPKPREPPRREDHCFVLSAEALRVALDPPARPMPLAQAGWDLRHYHAARVEHSRDLLRLYHYGPGARGVFRGDDLHCESIPKEDEAARFAGLLLFNEPAFEQALRDHQQYWHWRANRNEERWRRQEAGELDFDAKNLMHTVRLLLSGRSILEHGEPIVRFTGEPLALLRRIRAGDLVYQEILAIAEGLMADCERLKATSPLPAEVDHARLEELLRSLTASWERRQRC